LKGDVFKLSESKAAQQSCATTLPNYEFFCRE
jgi:hypothetical protein